MKEGRKKKERDVVCHGQLAARRLSSTMLLPHNARRAMPFSSVERLLVPYRPLVFGIYEGARERERYCCAGRRGLLLQLRNCIREDEMRS